MKVNEIKIENFRALANESYKFNEQFTVLIGDNGAGKTSILDAIAFSLGTIFLGIGEVKSFSLKQSDKRLKILSPNSQEVQLPLRIELSHTLNNREYNWARTANKPSGGATSYKEANELIHEIRNISKAVRHGEKYNLPLIAYFGVARLSDEFFERKKLKRSGSRFEGYKNALDPRALDHKALEWMYDAQSSVIQQFEVSETEIDRGLLRAFTESIETLIPDWKGVQYHLKRRDVIGRFEEENWQYLSMLSSGYKAIAKLAMDIAYRAVTLNPHLKENAVRETSGVVLIDEIDMHLHPNWQKQVINNLKLAFPNIQFIVTTHSPFIVQSLNASEIIKLNGEAVYENPQNKSLEEVAQDEMDVEDVARSKAFRNYQVVAAKYFDLIEQGKDSSNNEEVVKIKKQLDDLELQFTNDPAYLALMQAERKSELK